MATLTLDDARAVCKKRDAWWTVFLVDPFAVRLALLVANRTAITPDQLTLGAFGFGLAAAGCFFLADPWSLVAGAVLYHLSFVLDCIDGKVARLKGTGTLFGGWLDYMLDRLRVLCCGVGLVAGQFSVADDEKFLFLGFGILFMDMFRYANALHVSKTRMAMGIAVARHRGLPYFIGGDTPVAFGPQAGPSAGPVAGLSTGTCPSCSSAVTAPVSAPVSAPISGTAPVPLPGAVAGSVAGSAPGPAPARDLGQDAAAFVEDDTDADLGGLRSGDHVPYRERFPWYGRLVVFLDRHRVRIHLFSGVEFQMFVFIVAPLVAAVTGAWAMIPITAGSGVLLAVFELIVIYKLWMSAARCQRILGRPGGEPVPAQVPQPRTMMAVGER